MSNIVFVRRFKFPHSCSSEGRVFYKDTIYEAHYVEVDTRFPHGWIEVRFYAENGYFNFTEELFDRVIDEWGLIDIEAHEIDSMAKCEHVNDLYYINFGGESGYAVRADDKNIGTQLVDEGMATMFTEVEIKEFNNGYLFWHNFAEKV